MILNGRMTFQISENFVYVECHLPRTSNKLILIKVAYRSDSDSNLTITKTPDWCILSKILNFILNAF